MRNYTKRALSMLLCLALVFTFPMPVVFAESGMNDEMDSLPLGTSTDTDMDLPEEDGLPPAGEIPDEEGNEPQPTKPANIAPQSIGISATALPSISVRVEYTDWYGTFPADYEFHPNEGGGTIIIKNPSTEYGTTYTIYVNVQGWGETIGKSGTIDQMAGLFNIRGGVEDSDGPRELLLGFNVYIYGDSGPMPENLDLYYKITGRLFERDARDEEGYPVERPLTYDPTRFTEHERPMFSMRIENEWIDTIGQVKPDGNFVFYILKSVVDALPDGQSIFLQTNFPYLNLRDTQITPFQIKDGWNIPLLANWAGTVRGSISKGHLPADIVYNDTTSYCVLGFSALDGTTGSSFWSYRSLNSSGDNISFYCTGIDPGEYRVYFGYSETLYGAVSIFQYYGGASFEDAAIVTVRAFGDLEGIDTVSWAGDRDHAGTGDIYGPVVENVSPLGKAQSQEGELLITFSEPIDTGASGTVRLTGSDETVENKTLPAGSWSDGDTTYTVAYAGLEDGRLYSVEVSGFKDIPGNVMATDSRYSFVVRNGEIPRVFEHTTTGIQVQGEFTPDATINILEGLAGAHGYGVDPACDAMHEAQDDGLLLSVHDITVNDGRFTGEMTITIPVDAQYNGYTVSIFHCKNGVLETKTATVTGGKVTFTLDSLSPIGISLLSGSSGSIIDLSNNTPPASGTGWTYANNVYTILNGADVTVTGGTIEHRIEVAANANAHITLSNALFFIVPVNQSSLKLNAGANLTLTLAGAGSILRGESDCPAIQILPGASLTIDGEANLVTAVKTGSADIGGDANGDCGSVAINGGVITTDVNGGGIVTASGAFAMNGNAIVVTSNVTDTTPKQQGILYIGNTGTVYGHVTLAYAESSVPGGRTLTVPAGTSLTIAAGTELNVAGFLIPANGSTVTVLGTVDLGENLRRINGANVGVPTVNGLPTHNSVTVSAASLLATTGQDIEHAIGTTQTVPTTGWQSGTTFTGLTANTTYYVFARSKEDAHFASGTASMSAAITTADAPDTTPPTLSGGTAERTSHTRVQIGFYTNEAGSIHGLALLNGMSPPTKETVKSSGVSLGSVVSTGLMGAGLDITYGAWDIYVVMVDAAGNISNPLHIPVPAYNPVQAQAITSVTSPVAGATPNTAINNGTGFTAALTWDGNPSQFDNGTAYTAHITLTASSGYTFHGVFGDTAAISGFMVNGVAPVWVSNNGTILEFTVTFPATAALGYSATVTPTSKTFTAATYGYSEQAAQQFAVTNTGTGQITGLTASLQNGASFEISAPLSSNSINAGNTATVSVRPKTGLAAGTYTDTLNITGDNGISLSVNISLAVDKAPQNAPSAPTQQSKTATSITLSTISGAEYRQGATGAWQDNQIFSGLTPDTSYTFYARLKESANYNASSASSASSVITTNKAALGGVVTIGGTAKFGQTLTANTSSLTSTPSTAPGTLSYQWKRGTTNIGTNAATYTLVQADIEHTITVTVTATNCSGEVVSAATATVTKADGPTAPSSVTGSYTGDGSTFTYTVNIIAGAEYSKDGTNWQDSNVFTGFTTTSPASTFYGRIKATTTHSEGASGNTGAVTFAKLANSSVPTLDYTVTGTSPNKTVTITTVPGAEYKFGAGSWGATNHKTYATDDTETTYIRYAATATHNESASASTTVNLANAEQTAPSGFMLTFTLNGDNATFTATIPAVTGGEYSFNGVAFSSSNTKADCQPNTSYTGYVRLAAKTGFNASPVTSDTKTTPMLTVATPVISPASTSFTGSQSVTITCATPGAAIYYTTDGSAPTVASTPYTAPFNVTATTTVRAIAIHAGMNNSASASATYTLTVSSNLVIVNDSYAGTTGADSYAQGATVTINAGSRSNYRFSGWTVNSGGVTLSNANNATATFIMPSVAVTVTANWTYTGSTGGGGGSYTPPSNWTVTVDKQPNMPTTATVSISGTVDMEGNLSITMTDTMMKDAIEKAKAEAKRLGKEADGIVIEIRVTTTNGIKSLTVKCETGAISRLNTAGAGLSVNSSIYRFTLDAAAVKELNTQAKNGLTFTATPVTKLSDAAAAAIGNRPVFDFTAKDGNGKVITSYGKGTITRGIKYTAVGGERTGSLFIVKIVDGKVHWIDKSSYDNGWVIWTGDSNSVYGVGYKTPAPAFTDTTNHWARNDIDFVASRGLIAGSTATTFSPNTAITRADFLMALGKLSGADISSYKTSSFTDVPRTDPAMPYIEWAYQSKIVSGIGNNKFAPGSVITRQEMAVMMVNYAKVTNYTLPVSRQAVAFADDAQIASWAKDQVKAIQQTGVISGKPNNLFDPLGNATRAEASAMIHRFVELVIDEGTARGWAQNDAGQWQYINTYGKAVTGWLSTTDGSKYWFDDKGIMVSGKWVQISGKAWRYRNCRQSAASRGTRTARSLARRGKYLRQSKQKAKAPYTPAKTPAVSARTAV